jgi:hypothetical protein
LAQYTTQYISGEDKITLVNGVKSYLPELKIDGNTIQENYQNKNLFDASKSELKDCTYENGIYTAVNSNCCVDIKLPAGKYTISFVKSSDFSVYLRNGKVASGYISMIGATANTATFNFAADNDGYLRISWFAVGESISNIQLIYKDATPNPNFPIDIVNAGDNGVDIEVRGANLMNPALYRQNPYTYQGITVYGDGEDIIMTGTAKISVYNSVITTPDKLTPLPESMRGKTLYISKYQTGLHTNTPVEIGFYNDSNQAVFFYSSINGEAKEIFVPADRTKWWIRVRFTKDVTYDERIKLMISERKCPYEPYTPPTTISIPSTVGDLELSFAKCGNYTDKLIVDGINKRVIYQENVGKIIMKGTENIDIPGTSLEAYNLSAFRYMPHGTKYPYYCNYLKGLNSNYGYAKSECLAGYGAGGQFFFCISTDRIPLNDCVAFKSYLADLYNVGTPYIIQFGLATPKEHDLTDSDFGQQLLNLIVQRGITTLELTNRLPQKMSAKYIVHAGNRTESTSVSIIDNPPSYTIYTNVENIFEKTNAYGLELLIKGEE